MVEALTTNLRLQIEKTNHSFNRWVVNKNDWLQSNDATYGRQLEECNYTIQALAQHDVELENSRSVNGILKAKQQEEITGILEREKQIQQRVQMLAQQLQKSEESEEKEMRRLEEARASHEAARVKMEQSLNDLTHGIRLFLSLGLEFQKAEGDCMKFVFTQIDLTDPARSVHFLMLVDTDNLYNLVGTQPKLPTEDTSPLVDDLNDKNDIGKFVCQMRKLFCRAIR